MDKYKPGQVLASLFLSQNKTSRQSNENPLAKLFSPDTNSSSPRQPQSLHTSGITKSLKNKAKKTKNTSSVFIIKKHQPVPERKKENPSKVKTQAQGENSLRKKKKNSPDDHKRDVRQPHQTEQQSVEEDSPLSAKKRKLVDTETGEQVRPRRDRQRDKQSDMRTVFVGNCPLSADKKTLKKLFHEFGEIETIRFRCAPPADPKLPRRAIVITKNFHDQCSTYVAYVVYKEESAAQKALARNGYFLDNLHLRVDIAASSSQHDKKRTVFVGNLPFTVTEEDVRSHFADCGTVINVRIVRDRQTSLGKGISYVQFESEDSATLALKLNTSKFKGRKVRVMKCANKVKVKVGKDKVGTSSKSQDKSKQKKLSFAPSNATGSSFRNILKTKKDKMLRKIKKKKTTAKKSDGLSSIFGDVPVTKKLKMMKLNTRGKARFSSQGKKTGGMQQKKGGFKGKQGKK